MRLQNFQRVRLARNSAVVLGVSMLAAYSPSETPIRIEAKAAPEIVTNAGLVSIPLR